MDFIAATNNAHKAQELEKILGGYRLTTMRSAGFTAEIIEDGKTFAENAMIKARAVYRALGKPCIADDSGLCVDALDGAPGIYSARFGGEGATDRDKYEKLLKLLENTPDEKRTARFVCVMACILDDETAFTVEGVCEGSILRAPVGLHGFGYDPVFRPAGRECSMAELSEDEKNRISHRALAADALQKRISEILEGVK